MNQDVTHSLHEVIRKQLHQADFDIVGITAIPAHSDRMIRLRTLQEMLEDFEEFRSNDTIDYLLQIKPRRQQPQQQPQQDNTRIEVTSSKAAPESIYLPNGKLNIPFLIRNADLLFDSGDYVLAKNIYKTILKTGENTSAALFRMGRCFEAEGKYEEALVHFEESIAYHPSLECFQRLSALLLSQNKDLQAGEILERAMNLKDLNPSARFELFKAAGNCWTRAKRIEYAERNFKKALEINPSADDIRANLGALYLQANKIPEAKRYFRDATASNPENYQAMAGLGSCSLAEGDRKSAHDHFAQSLNIELNNPNAIFYLVKCAYELKSYAVASKILEEYIQIAPVNPNLLYSLAGLQFHLGRIQDAKITTSKILELQSQHEGAKDLLNLIERYTGPTAS